MKHLLGLQLWHLFKYAELTKMVRQNGKLYTCLIKFELVTLMVMQKIFKARFAPESDENYPKAALHLYAENQPVMKRNEVVVNDLPGNLYK